MGNFERGGRGGDRGGFRSGGGNRGGGERRFDRDSGPKEMHQATCAACHKSCEVPFRPTGDKPVYCRDCFMTQGGGNDAPRGGDRFQKSDRRDFAPKMTPRIAPQGGGNEDLKKQLEAVNAKLERLIGIMQGFSFKKEIADVTKNISSEKKTEKVEKKEITKKTKKKGPVKR